MSRPVGVNLLWLRPGEVGGSEEYATRLLGAVAGLPDPPEVVLFAAPGLADAHPGLAAAFRVEQAPTRGGRPGRVAVEASWLPARARRVGVGLLHHMGGTVPPVAGPAPVVTVHDLQPLHHPENFSPVKRAYLRAMLPWSVRRARRVVAVSAWTAGALSADLHVPADRLAVVRHGIDPAEPPPASEIQRVRARYGLGERWFTYPAVTWPHKDHVTLVAAFGTVAADDPDVRLVLTGADGPAADAVASAVAASAARDRIVRPGRVPRPDLDALIAGAVAVPFCSTYEGFGAPVLEAMALGVPVVASRAGALPEAVGDAGLLVEPRSPDALARAMHDLLTQPDLHRRLAAAGRARAVVMTWEEPATTLVQVWRDVAA